MPLGIRILVVASSSATAGAFDRLQLAKDLVQRPGVSGGDTHLSLPARAA